MDRGIVVKAEFVPCQDGETYDILPFGSSGLYWVGGILLKSTIQAQ